MDLSSLMGTLLGLIAIVGGQILEGGSLGQITQGTSLLIVLGGTFGATLLSFPGKDIIEALARLPEIYLRVDPNPQPVIEEIIKMAHIARREGVLAMEAHRNTLSDPLLKRGLKFIIDGFESHAVREILEAEIDQAYEVDEAAAKVFEGAGGYAPTIGILGAVLGLIHVMSMLSDPSRIGEGIAVAFVATVYGVAIANLILIPWGNKLKRIAQMRRVTREMVKSGVMGIQEGLNPGFLNEKLQIYAAQSTPT